MLLSVSIVTQVCAFDFGKVLGFESKPANIVRTPNTLLPADIQKMIMDNKLECRFDDNGNVNYTRSNVIGVSQNFNPLIKKDDWINSNITELPVDVIEAINNRKLKCSLSSQNRVHIAGADRQSATIYEYIDEPIVWSAYYNVDKKRIDADGKYRMLIKEAYCEK